MFINELKALFKEKKLLHLVFFGITILEGLGTIFNKFLDREITVFIPLLLILIIYLVNTEKMDLIFLISLVLNFIGMCYFNSAFNYFNPIGLIIYAMAYISYTVILFKNYELINAKKLLKISIIIITLITVPVVIYTRGINKMDIFNESMLYILSASIFITSAIVFFLNNKTKVNYLLFYSGISILLNSYFQGYNLFMEASTLFQCLAVILFNLTHYFMCMFLIEKSKEKVVTI